VQDEASRSAVLAALSNVDGVVLFDEETPLELIRELAPDVLVKGGDYTPDQVVGREIVEGGNGRVVIVPLVPGQSSTKLAARLKTVS
jgi:D-beta-D-heptose 7-phosphate kinase/D-beta-D-heptose 1-phosphate adenosyltransferase